MRTALEKLSRLVFGYLGAAADFLFGYDFFISYAHDDGIEYPRLLRDRLEALGYRTFLDVHGYTGGDDLRGGTRRRIGMSKRLILLARRHAMSLSPWVLLELQHFIALGRSPIVIEFPGALAAVPEGSPLAALLQERLSIRETLPDHDGTPSEATIQELVRSFDATRQETIRLRALGAAAVVFIIIAIAAVWQWYAAVQERRIAVAQRGDAQATSRFVEASRMMAEWDVEAVRRAGLAAETERLSAEATAGGPSPVQTLRLNNLRSELAETEKTMSQLADDAKDARRAGHEELRRANLTWAQVNSDPASIRPFAVPQIFSIEVLSVGAGESFILHYGDPDAPRFILIDGGRGDNYLKALRPRLESLRKRWTPPEGKLPIEYMMVSNHDDDRLGGFDRMFREMLELQRNGAQSPFDIKNVWFESFVPPYSGGWLKALTRQRVDQLRIPVNKPFDHLVTRPNNGRVTIDLGNCLLATILGPDTDALAGLHKMWAERAKAQELDAPIFPTERFDVIPKVGSECREMGAPPRQTATARVQPPEKHVACDETVVNRASLIILFEQQGRRFLHPGDSCSEQIEAGLRAAGLSGPGGSFQVDVLLVPHLGSARNVNIDFFRRVKARQYLFTSSGRWGLPRDGVLQMILDARRDDAGRRDKYTFLFLNRDGTEGLGTRLDRFFASRSSDEFGYRRIFRSTAETSILIDLLERVRY